MAGPGDPTPLSSFRDLVAHFEHGSRPREAFRVGMEYEKLALDARTLAPLPYEAAPGAPSIRLLLEHLAAAHGWRPSYEGDLPIALERDRASITLEPGGQFEMSGAPLRTIFEVEQEVRDHVRELAEAGDALGVRFAWVGCNPSTPLQEVPWMPKGRYAIMRAYMPTRGRLGHHMMKLTCTVQANVDYRDEAEAMEMLRTASVLTPVVVALFANSPWIEGHETFRQSYRSHIWTDVDPDRCGIPGFFLREDASFRDYADWAVDVPMYFLYRDGRYVVPSEPTTFRSFLERGLGAERATAGDWELHLSTLFPEVRIKRHIELRGADCVPPAWVPALAALWKGVLYDPEARRAAWELVPVRTPEQHAVLRDEASRLGPCAQAGGHYLEDLATELVRIAEVGLRRIAPVEGLADDETGFLAPIWKLLAPGRSLANEVRDAMTRGRGLLDLCV
jgi:glutamate--cysteine ligase